MNLPELPEGWHWIEIKEWRWLDWGFVWGRHNDFGNGYYSIVWHIGPYFKSYKTKEIK